MRFVFLLIFFLSIYILYKGLDKDPSTIPSNLISKQIPEFSVKTFYNENLSNFDLSNEVIMVNFFATWCPPCRAEHPQLESLSSDIPIYGIAKKDEIKELSVWLKKLGNPYRKIGLDFSGLTSISWGVYGLPETFIIDKDGFIRYKHLGPIMKNDLKRIRNIINELE